MARRRSRDGERPTRGAATHRRSPRHLAGRAAAVGDRGAVLLEAALAIPVLVAVAVCLGWAVSLAGTTMVLGDAVRGAAREIARGVTVGAALDTARSHAPGAVLRVEDDGASVVVVADQQVSAPVPLLRGISVTLTQRVAIPREWSDEGP